MKIERCSIAHAQALTSLFVEMEEYYFGAGCVSPREMLLYLRERVLSPDSGMRIIAARQADTLVGFASFTLMHPGPRRTGQAYMKELFVSHRARGLGAGRALMRFIAEAALAQGCSRLDWTAERSNPRAGTFYQSLGAALIEDKQYFRFEGDALQRFVAQTQALKA